MTKDVLLILSDINLKSKISASGRLNQFCKVLDENNIKYEFIYSFDYLNKYFRIKNKFYGYYRMLFPISFIRIFLFTFLLIKNENKNKYFAVLSSLPTGDMVISSFLISKLLKIKFIVDIRDQWPLNVINVIGKLISNTNKNVIIVKIYDIWKSFFYHTYVKFMHYIISSADSVLYHAAIEHSYMWRYLKKMNIKDNQLFYYPNGIDTSIFTGYIKKQIKYDFIFVGNIGSYYSLNPLIKLFDKITHIKISILIIGYYDGSSCKTLIDIFEKYKNVEILFHKPVSLNRLKSFLDESLFGLIFYNNDKIWLSAVGTKFFEYAVSGLNILCTGPMYSDLYKLCSIFDNWIFIENNVISEKKLLFIQDKLMSKENLDYRFGISKYALENFSRDNYNKNFLSSIFTVDS